MRKFIAFQMLLFLIISGCADNGVNYDLSEVKEDFSSIEDPRARWDAYKLNDYYVEQSWACECLPPYGGESYIVDGKVKSYEFYDLPEGEYSEEQKEWGRTRLMTIDEAFDLIESYEGKAHSVQIEYDTKFGYPTKINIDIDEMMADEEIHHSFSNLKEIK